MFAIASQMSFVVFRSKTDLINHYKEILHANVLHDRIISIRHALFEIKKVLTKIKLCKPMDLLKQGTENRR